MSDYYREPNGDYLKVETQDDPHPRSCGVRAAGIEHVPSSVCTTSAARRYLATCDQVDRADVPGEWLRYIDPGV